MPVTILVTGFGPFPGALFNPTGPLVQRLARLRRPALADTKIVAHIFPTSYAAVDRDLPRLIAKHKPDAVLMFGLAPRAKTIRIETRARNAASLLPDARDVLDASGGPLVSGRPTAERGLFFCGARASPTGQIREIAIEAERIAASVARLQANF